MIILTKEISAALAAMKLDELTLSRTSDGVLTLAGKECGKPILTLSHMPVSKKLTVAERKILTDDYIMPVLAKSVKDVVTLVSLMKDTRTTDDLEAFKKDLKEVHDTEAGINTAYDHIKQVHSVYKYHLHKRIPSASYRVYLDTDDDSYTTNIDITKDTDLAVMYAVKHSDKTMKIMFKQLVTWRQLNEALAVQTNKIEELQGKISAKCAL